MRKFKSILLILAFLGIAGLIIPLHSQVPDRMSYQAVIRDLKGEIWAGKEVLVRVSILIGSERGSVVFSELHSVTTNENGLLSIEIGAGNFESGSIEDINWARSSYFLQSELDLEGKGFFGISITNPLLSVPYALHARTAERLSGEVPEKDPLFSISPAAAITSGDITSWNNQSDFSGDYQSLTNKPFIITENELNAGSKRITQLGNPLNASDAATKAYVDEMLSIIQTIQVGVNDLDGNRYKVIMIGNQVWMAENLKTTKYNDGTSIPLVTDNTAWSNLTTPGYCWYNNNESNKDTYGALYNWYAVNTGKLCPTGWRVPTDADWTTMENYLIANGFNYDGTTTGNKIAKALASTSGWTTSSSTGAVGNTDYPSKRNATGFTVLPGGYRFGSGVFGLINNFGFWWSATPIPSGGTFVWSREMDYRKSSLDKYGYNTIRGHSVRCIKD